MGGCAGDMEGARAGAWGLLMGRSWTMLRLGPRQVKVRNGLGTGGLLLPTGTERIDSFTCMTARKTLTPDISYPYIDNHILIRN